MPLAPLAALAVLATAACEHHSGPRVSLEVPRDTLALAEGSSVLGTAPITIGDFQLRARNSGLRSRWPPVIFQVTVTVTNTSQEARTLRVLGSNCAVLVRIYEHHASLGKPVFDASGPGVACYVPVLRFPLKPGESTRLQSAGDGPGIELPPGRYDVGAIVTMIEASRPQRVEVPAGSVRVPAPYE